MLKQILIKCSEILNRDDISKALKNVSSLDEISNESIQSDVIRMISYYNFVCSNIYENYLKISNTESLFSDENNRIYFSSLKYKPVKILSVKTPTNQNTLFSIHTTFISTNSQNSEYVVSYNYTPDEINDLSDAIDLPYNINSKIICYGIACEFLASKDQFEKSEFWKNKFMYELFKVKIKKERRLKSTF